MKVSRNKLLVNTKRPSNICVMLFYFVLQLSHDVSFI